MENLPAIPQLSPAESEEFFATGTDARRLEPDPESGVTEQSAHGRSYRLEPVTSAGKPRWRVSLYLAGTLVSYALYPQEDRALALKDGLGWIGDAPSELAAPQVPQQLTESPSRTEGVDGGPADGSLAAGAPWERRPLDPIIGGEGGALFVELLFAARAKAESDIKSHPFLGGWCDECTAPEIDGQIAHKPLCKTGRVMRAIANICAVSIERVKHGTEPRPMGLNDQLRASIRREGGAL